MRGVEFKSRVSKREQKATEEHFFSGQREKGAEERIKFSHCAGPCNFSALKGEQLPKKGRWRVRCEACGIIVIVDFQKGKSAKLIKDETEYNPAVSPRERKSLFRLSKKQIESQW